MSGQVRFETTVPAHVRCDVLTLFADAAVASLRRLGSDLELARLEALLDLLEEPAGVGASTRRWS